MTEWHRYQVGELFVPGRTRWPESPHLWMDDGIRLALFVTRPVPAEVQAVGAGVARFAWVRQRFTGFLLLRFGDLPWTEAPYNPQRATGDNAFALERMPKGTHAPVVVLLVDASTGLIVTMRSFSWPGYFVNTIIDSVEALRAAPWSDPAATAEYDQFMATYPDGPALGRLVKSKALATCTGGQRDDNPR